MYFPNWLFLAHILLLSVHVQCTNRYFKSLDKWVQNAEPTQGHSL